MLNVFNRTSNSDYKIQGNSDEPLSNVINSYCEILSRCRDELTSNTMEVVATLKVYSIPELSLMCDAISNMHSIIQTQMAELAFRLDAVMYKVEIAYYFAVNWEFAISIYNNRADHDSREVNKLEMINYIVDVLVFIKVLQYTAPTIYTNLTFDTGMERYLEKIY